MRKLIITGVILLVFIASSIFILVNLSNIINKNKQSLLARAEKELQRKIDVEDIRVNLWGGIGVLLKGIALGDDPSFSSENFLRAASLQVNVRLLPLFRKDFQVKNIILYDPVISIIRNEKGQFNFESIARKSSDRKEAMGPATPNKPSENGDITPLSLLVSLLDIRNGQIRYTDKTKKEQEQIRVRDLDLEVGDIGFKHPIRINLSANLLESKKKNIILEGNLGPLGYQVDLAKIPVQGTIQVGPLYLDEITRVLPQIAKNIPQGMGIGGPFRLQADVKGTSKALKISNIDLRASIFGSKEPNLKIKGGEVSTLGTGFYYQDLDIKAHIELAPVILENMKKFTPFQKVLPAQLKATGPMSLITDVSGSLQKLNVAAFLEATQANIELSKDLKKSKGIPLTVSLKCQKMGEKIICEEFQFGLHQLEGKVSGELQMGKTPSVNGTIKSNKIKLGGWEEIVPSLKDYTLSGVLEIQTDITGSVGGKKIPNIEGKVDLTNASVRLPQLQRKLEDINAFLRLTGDSAELEETTLRWGSSPIKITARVQNFTKPRLTYEFSSPDLKLSDFLKSDSTKPLQEDVLRGVTSKGEMETAGGKVGYQGMVSAVHGTIRKIDYHNIQSVLSFTNQVATIEKLQFEAFDGLFRGRGQCSFQDSKNPLFNFNSEIVDMDIKKLLVAVAIQESLIGKLKLDFDIRGQGEQWRTIQQTLMGKGKLEIQNGALLNINIPDMVLSKVTGVPGLSTLMSKKMDSKYARVFEAKDTQFEEMKGSFLIDRGETQIKDLTIAAPDYSIQGNGRVRLDNKVDFSANLIMAKEFSKNVMDDIKEAKYLANEEGQIELPFRLTGQLLHIKAKPDVAYVKKKMQRALLQEGTGKLLEKLFPPKKRSDSPSGVEQTPSSPPEPQKQEKPEDIIQKTLEGLFGR